MHIRRLVAISIALGLLAPVGALAAAAATESGPGGRGPISSFTPPTVPSFAKVSAGRLHSCAVSTAGAAWCFGTNLGSRLGNPSVQAAYYPLAVDVSGSALDGKTVADLDVGDATTCAVTTVGGVACWGGSEYAGIGDGSVAARAVPTSPDFSGTALSGTLITQVEVSAKAACAASTDGHLACWGLRPGTATTDTRPRDVEQTGTPLAGKAIAAFDTTGDHACAASTDGLLACWGSSSANRLGPHTSTDSLTPIAVDLTGSALAGKDVVDVATDAKRTCALASDGTVSCWGSGLTGFLNLPTTGTPLEGKAIAAILHVTGLTCARASDGTFACIGDNSAGRGGRSGSDTTTWSSIQSGGTAMAGKLAADLSAGPVTTCAATTTGSIACWGANAYGEGGNAGCHDYLACAAGYGPPGAPSSPKVVGGPRSLTVTWGPPASSGGYPTSGYRVTVGALFFSKVVDLPPDATSVTVGGLTNDLNYKVLIAASNERGRGTDTVPIDGLPKARPTTVAPFATWDAFTEQQFADLEGRTPTAGELSTWTTALGADATKKGTLVEGIRRGTDNTTAVDPAVRLYRAFLGRIPDAGGLRFWVNRRRTGTWTLVRIADSFATSSEFKRKYGALSNEQFVTRIYTDVLGRDADPTGVDYWTRQLDLKRRTRGSVMVGFSESSEYKTKQAEGTDVVVAYVYLLGRAPTTAEETSWLALRKANVTHAQLVRELLDSQAYADRITG